MGTTLEASGQGPSPATGVPYAKISETDLREWLSYLASDELQGRQVFTEGYGRATQYIADQLKGWGVKPIGQNGTYFQPVKLKGYRVTRNSTVTVEANGQSRTFKHGDHVTFSTDSGGKQTLRFDGVEFVGYGLTVGLRGTRSERKADRDCAESCTCSGSRRRKPGRPGAPAAALAAEARVADLLPDITRGAAAAAISFAPTPAAPSAAEQALAQALTALNQANAAVTQAQQALRGGRGGRGGNAPAAGARGAQTADITTVQRVDSIVTPSFTADETFFETLFSGSPVSFADIRAKAERGEPIRSNDAGGESDSEHRQHVRGDLRADHPQRGRNGGRDGSCIEGHVRSDRRASRSRRLQPDRCGARFRNRCMPATQPSGAGCRRCRRKSCSTAHACARCGWRWRCWRGGGGAATCRKRRWLLSRQRCLSTSGTWSAMEPTTTVRDRPPSLRLRRRLPPGPNRNGPSSLSGTPEKNPACTVHATTPISHSCRTKRSRPAQHGYGRP